MTLESLAPEAPQNAARNIHLLMTEAAHAQAACHTGEMLRLYAKANEALQAVFVVSRGDAIGFYGDVIKLVEQMNKTALAPNTLAVDLAACGRQLADAVERNQRLSHHATKMAEGIEHARSRSADILRLPGEQQGSPDSVRLEVLGSACAAMVAFREDGGVK